MAASNLGVFVSPSVLGVGLNGALLALLFNVFLCDGGRFLAGVVPH
jgi:hypothetical protein